MTAHEPSDCLPIFELLSDSLVSCGMRTGVVSLSTGLPHHCFEQVQSTQKLVLKSIESETTQCVSSSWNHVGRESSLDSVGIQDRKQVLGNHLMCNFPISLSSNGATVISFDYARKAVRFLTRGEEVEFASFAALKKVQRDSKFVEMVYVEPLLPSATSTSSKVQFVKFENLELPQAMKEKCKALNLGIGSPCSSASSSSLAVLRKSDSVQENVIVNDSISAVSYVSLGAKEGEKIESAEFKPLLISLFFKGHLPIKFLAASVSQRDHIFWRLHCICSGLPPISKNLHNSILVLHVCSGKRPTKSGLFFKNVSLVIVPGAIYEFETTEPKLKHLEDDSLLLYENVSSGAAPLAFLNAGPREVIPLFNSQAPNFSASSNKVEVVSFSPEPVLHDYRFKSLGEAETFLKAICFARDVWDFTEKNRSELQALARMVISESAIENPALIDQSELQSGSNFNSSLKMDSITLPRVSDQVASPALISNLTESKNLVNLMNSRVETLILDAACEERKESDVKVTNLDSAVKRSDLQLEMTLDTINVWREDLPYSNDGISKTVEANAAESEAPEVQTQELKAPEFKVDKKVLELSNSNASFASIPRKHLSESEIALKKKLPVDFSAGEYSGVSSGKYKSKSLISPRNGTPLPNISRPPVAPQFQGTLPPNLGANLIGGTPPPSARYSRSHVIGSAKKDSENDVLLNDAAMSTIHHVHTHYLVFNSALGTDSSGQQAVSPFAILDKPLNFSISLQHGDGVVSKGNSLNKSHESILKGLQDQLALLTTQSNAQLMLLQKELDLLKDENVKLSQAAAQIIR